MKLITEIVAGLGLLAYLAGWLYLYYFLRFFGFDIFEVEIPFHYFFIYAFPSVVAPVLKFFVLSSVLLALVIMIVARCFFWVQLSSTVNQIEWWISRRFRGSSFDIVIIRLVGVLSLTLLTLALIVVVADKSATTQAKRVISGAGVYVSLADDYQKEIEQGFKEFAKFKIDRYLLQESKADLVKFPVKIVLADKSRYYLFLVKDAENNTGIALSLPKSGVNILGVPKE